MTNHDSAGLARRARELREEKGLTLKAVGDMLRKADGTPISRQSIHQAEDEARVGLDSLRIRIIEALGGTVVEGPLYIERPRGLFDAGETARQERRSKAA